MSLLQSLSQGSLFSDESLLQAREGYLPIPQVSDAELSFEQWTKRMTTQHELAIAREMAGLSEDTLAGLASVFARRPRRGRSDRLRFAIPLGAALVVIGIALLMLGSSDAPSTGAAVLKTLAVGALGGGVIALCIGVLTAFSMMSLEVAHGRLGLCASLLDEQHPWLYKASFAMRDHAADAYRQRILSERGPLRGIDYLMMREIAKVQDALEMTRVARTVAEALARIDAPADEQSKERRLASVPSAIASMAEEASHGPSVRSFGATAKDRRRPG